MKPSKLFRAIRQSQRDRRVYGILTRPRLIMPVPEIIDLSIPYEMHKENCHWYFGIQNLIVPSDWPPQTRETIRIDVTDPNRPASVEVQGYTSGTQKSVGYKAIWNGSRWTHILTNVSTVPQPADWPNWQKVSLAELDWIRTDRR